MKPLVVFVGDGRVKDRWGSTDTRVFTSETLGRYIASQQPRLQRSAIDLVASHLERSARSA